MIPPNCHGVQSGSIPDAVPHQNLNIMKANFWVIATGKDCEGYNSGRVSPFTNEPDANKFADDMNDWSDGIGYRVISDLWDMKAYCERYGKDWEKYVDA